MKLAERKPLHSPKFRRDHPAARAFHAPQKPRENAEAVRSTYEAPKPEKRAYRGSDNPKAQRAASRAGGRLVPAPRMHVPPEFRPALLPGRDSRRERGTVWLPTTPAPVAA